MIEGIFAWTLRAYPDEAFTVGEKMIALWVAAPEYWEARTLSQLYWASKEAK